VDKVVPFLGGKRFRYLGVLGYTADSLKGWPGGDDQIICTEPSLSKEKLWFRKVKCNGKYIYVLQRELLEARKPQQRSTSADHLLLVLDG